ncbi:hypothetical protein Tco_0190368 [Tanacetum coccineum]
MIVWIGWVRLPSICVIIGADWRLPRFVWSCPNFSAPTGRPFRCVKSKFKNDQFAPILRYGDLVQGNVTIKRVYYVEGLNNNLFLVGQFCDADLELAFRKATCFVRCLQGNDLLTGTRGSDLYIITLHESSSPTPMYFMAKASMTQAWLWHQ